MTGLTLLRTSAFALALSLPAGAALAAPTVHPCDAESGYGLDPEMIPEPWEDFTATYGKGNIRVTLLDTYEPAVVPFRLMVLTPPADESGARACFMVMDGSAGFSGFDFAARKSSYDPAKGTILTFPVQVYDQEIANPKPATLQVTIDQSKGAVTANLVP